MKDLSYWLRYAPETGQLYWLNSPTPRVKVGQEAGGKHNQGYRRIKIEGKSYLAHRVAWYLHLGAWPDEDVDHVNRDRSDNRIDNLRLANRRDNIRNLKREGGSSCYKGVSWDNTRNKWVACIKYEGKNHNLGRYTSEEEAALAYNKVAKEKFGEFAYLNIHPAISNEAIIP